MLVRLDDSIYVSNAFPVFNAIDKLIQSERNIQIFDDVEILPSLHLLFLHHLVYHLLTITDGGTGYLNVSSPNVAISSALIKRKDPISGLGVRCYYWYYIFCRI